MTPEHDWTTIRSGNLEIRIMRSSLQEGLVVIRGLADRPAQDHIGPEPGKHFLSLNLTEEQWKTISAATFQVFDRSAFDVFYSSTALTPEEALTLICRQWLTQEESVKKREKA